MCDLQTIRNRPNFFVIGAAKSGSTRMHYLLGQHPEVFTSRVKEPNTFCFDPPRKESNELYISLFEDVEGAKAIGESSMIYSSCKRWPGTARRIHEFNPEARIIYIMRHPLRRLESGWVQQRHRTSTTPRSFSKTIRSDHYGMFDTTFYWKQLNEYRQFFPDAQILLLFFEDFVKDEAATLRRCFEFLGVDADVAIDCSTQEQQNAFASKREPIPLLDFLRGSSIFRSMRGLLPLNLKDKMRFLWTRPFRSKPRWDEETFQYVKELLYEDAQQLLAFAGKPADFWNWELKPEQKI